MKERSPLEVEIPAMNRMVVALKTMQHNEAARAMQWLNSYHDCHHLRRVEVARVVYRLCVAMGRLARKGDAQR